MILNNIGKDSSQDQQGGRKRSADVKKQTHRKPQAPAVTYATYRGSARIRQLLKSQSEKTDKGEESTENENASVIKENGEIKTVVSPKSEHLTKENGEDEDKDHEDDVIVNSSTVKMELKKSGEVQHYLGSSKHEIMPDASASSTGSFSGVDLKHAPASEANKVERAYSQDLLLSSSRNSEIPTNSTDQITNALSAVDSLFGKEYVLLGEAEAPFQMDKNATSNCEKEIHCSDHSYQEPTEKMQDGCLQSLRSNGRVNKEVQLSKGEYCCNHQMNNHSELTSNVQMHHSNTTFQQQADEHTGGADKDSDPRKSDAQKIVAAAEREQNSQNFLASVLLPVTEQTCTSLSVESREECISTGNLTASKLTVKNDEDTIMDQVTCNEELNELGKLMHVQNEHQLNLMENSKDTAIPQPGLSCLGKNKVLSEVAVESFADVSCTRGCKNVKSDLDELTASLSVSFKSSFETSDCYSASLHSDCKSVNKTIVKSRVGSKEKRDTVSTPDLECEKSKFFETVDMSISENSSPTHGTVSYKTVEDVPEKTLVTLAEDNASKPAPCPLVSTERTDDPRPAASKISGAGMNEMDLASFESKNCISELSPHISKSQEKNLVVPHPALRCEGKHLTDQYSTICEQDIDVDIISASPHCCESRHINISSKAESNNKHGVSSTVLYSSSDNQGKVPSATNSENGQVTRWSDSSKQDGCIFLTTDSKRIIPEDRMTEAPLCSEDQRSLCPPISLEPEFTPAVLHHFTSGVDVRDFCTPRSPSSTQESEEGSDLSVSPLEISGIAQENCSSSGHKVGVEAKELSSAQQADDSVLAKAMPSPVCPWKRASNSECTEVCKNAVQQMNLCNQTSGISEALSDKGEQTAAAATESSDLYFEKIWKSTNRVEQVCTDLQDASLLFKKAEEIVDSVLHLAIEEIIAKQAVGVCQVCGRKDSLVNTDILNDQKTVTVQLEAEEIQSAVHSLKHFNESSRGDSFTENAMYDTNNQDEMIPSYIPAKIDLHSVLALKAREIIDEVINSAKQKLTSNQWQGRESEKHSKKIECKPEAENPEILNLDGNLSSKTQELIREPLRKAETRNISMNCEKAVCSGPPLFPDSTENRIDRLQSDEDIPNNAFTCQANGFLSTGSSASPESTPTILAKEEHDKKVYEHLAAAETCSKAGLSATSRKSDVSLCLINRDAAVTEEIVLPLQLNDSCSNTDTPDLMLLPSESVNLSSFMPDEESISTRSEYEVKNNPWGSLESSAEGNPIEHSGKEAAEMFSQVKAALEDSKVGESEEELVKGTSEMTLVNTELNTQFTDSELPVTEEHSEGKNYFNSVYAQNKEILKEVQMKDSDVHRGGQLEENGLDSSNDMTGSADLLGFSPLIEQQENSSFTIVYEGALQTENRSVPTGDKQTSSLSPSDLPLDSVAFLMCERPKNKNEPTCFYGKDNKLNKATEGNSSESFLSVEAKRYRIYPFSLSPIYEDDSSHEDLQSADTSPEGHPNGVSKDNSDHTSVLSLLQSVSERLQLTTQFSKEEDEEGMDDEDESSYEGYVLDVERGEEECLSSQWTRNLTTTILSNDQNTHPLPEQSASLSKEQHDSKEQTEQFQDETSAGQTYYNPVSQKADTTLKHPPTSVYYQYLRSANNYSSEKGTRFGNILQDILQPKIYWSQDHAMPKLGELTVNLVDRASLTYNPRPGKIIIYDIHGDKSKQEIHSDVLDATSWIFPIGALLRIIRGCWIFYEKPKFHGQKYILEEGEIVLDHLWDLPGVKHHRRSLTVGSIKHVTKDCSVPEIEFSVGSSTDGLPICIQSAVANLEELDVEKNPYIRVKSGIWLAYSDLNYKGEMKILEECSEPSEIPSADVRSVRPLKMGGLKVQMPMNVKIIIYEKPHFGGWSKEFSENISSVLALFGNEEDFQEIGSIRVIGGVWVAYDKERYKGRQYLLEEGDYEGTHMWGGAGSVLLSFRFLQADFIESSVALFQSDDEDGKALNIINEEVPDLEQTGFGPETGSILVKSGVWVAYQQKHFCGEQYVLEKGKYKCFFDWGGSSKIIMSIRPVKLEPLGTNEPPHLLKAFSNTHFQGACIDFTTEVSDFTSFIPCSFKVLRGCWLLYYQGEIDDDHCVLEEGLYIDLSSCGCPTAAIKSLKPIEYVFAEPSLSLFALECCKGRELHFSEPVNSVLNEDLHFYTQSVWVRSGLWIAYEGCHFLGKQILLEPGEISNWNEYSGWKVIGSLRPVKQPAVYLRIRNRAQGKYLTVAGSPADVRATSVCVSPYNSKDTQIWYYCRGLFKSKVNDACLDVIGGRDVPGAKVALWAEHGKERQKWRLNEDGTISSYLSDQLVLDIKGGNYYDKNHIIMNEPDEDKRSQKWDIEIL
ncbi:very large A-kinase anchor protein isoform X2 [Excalfactoria chinensis]